MYVTIRKTDMTHCSLGLRGIAGPLEINRATGEAAGQLDENAPMSHRKFGRTLAGAVAVSTKRTLAQRFARVLDRLKLDYDLDIDVVVEAERQLRSLRARELH